MDIKTYLVESSRTVPSMPNGMEVNDTVMEALRYCISQLVATGNPVDDLKKHIYYGKPFAWIDPINNVAKEKQTVSEFDADLIHAIVGIATEATELLEALYDMLSGQPVDKVNLVEEVGDLMWYQALLLRLLGSDFEQAGAINIEKLYKRFPQKFSGSEAINRDTVSERALLEKGVKQNESIISNIIQLN